MRIYRHAGLLPSGFIAMQVYRQWRLNSLIGNNGEWRCGAVDVSIFIAERCEVETGSIPMVGSGHGEVVKFARVGSEVIHFET